MKRKKTPQLLKSAGVCAGAVAVSAAMLTGCTWFGPHHNIPATEYGPPGMLEPDFDPFGNEPEDVYGPPIFWEDEEDDYDPAEDVPAPVYGPPGGMAFFIEEDAAPATLKAAAEAIEEALV